MERVKILRTLDDARALKPGQKGRWVPPLKFADKPYGEEHRCPDCRYLFYAEKAPKFCPGCGARWNGKVAAAAVEEG